MPKEGAFQGTGIDSVAQVILTGTEQAFAYSRSYGAKLVSSNNPFTFSFRNKRRSGVDTLKIHVLVSGSHVIDVKADVVDDQISFHLWLAVLTQIRAIRDVGKRSVVPDSWMGTFPFSEIRPPLHGVAE